MIEFALGFLFGIVAIYIGLKLLANMLLKRLEQQLDSLNKDIETLSKVVPARVEEDNGMFYIYSVTDNAFLAQGRTVDEIRQAVESRDASLKVTVTEGDESVIERLKATANA